ncbi:MAG: DNA helicase RecG, partial [Chloroflexota bacterium]
ACRHPVPDRRDGLAGEESAEVRLAEEASLDGLPFRLTGAQARALQEIAADLARPVPMSRLLQGEVGSGKTVVAGAAIAVACANGFQAAMMAPTEILTQQHYATLSRLLEPLLSGSLKKREKEEIWQLAASGEVDVLVGTHALIEDGKFKALGLVIVDEQHRFGVRQRANLRNKGYNPDVLVMTATPIPRTLALTIYGDLDISVIDELPPGRQRVKTRWVGPRERMRAYAFVREQVRQGHQAFIICPLIAESDRVDARAAVEEHARLQRQIFPDLKLELLHGRMTAKEKEAVMQRFRDGEAHILVSTAVVEVGIDVPNATVMLIEGADRFGLAQLHQFRGRVGRGPFESYCLLLSDSSNPDENPRLRAIVENYDGFKLAEEDLKLRGPGEFFGTRQSGLPDLKVAQLGDIAVLELARREAALIFAVDPELRRPDHALLAEKVRAFWAARREAARE